MKNRHRCLKLTLRKFISWSHTITAVLGRQNLKQLEGSEEIMAQYVISAGSGGKSSSSALSFSPDAYLDFLEEKVQSVRAKTSGSQAPSFNATPHSFSVLQQCSIKGLEMVIRSSPRKSCELDPIPTFLLKEFLNDLLPYLHLLCKSSLSTEILSCSQKKAIVTPAFKKYGLDVLNNFWPISNIYYLLEIVEKLVSMQLIAYLNGLGLLPSLQPGFCAGHSTETVLVRLLSDIFSATDRGEVTLLTLLDVSTACDSVDHDILLKRLRRTYGMDGHVFSWLESFIR